MSTDVQMPDADKQVIPVPEKKTEEDIEEYNDLYGAIKHGIDMLTLEDSDFTPKCNLFLEIIQEWSLEQLRKLPDLLLSQFAKQVIVNAVIKAETGKSVYQEPAEPVAEPKRKATPKKPASKTTAKRSRKAKAEEVQEDEEVPLKSSKEAPKKPATNETKSELKKSPAKDMQRTPPKSATTPQATPISQNSFLAKRKIKVLPEEYEKIRKDIDKMCVYCNLRTKAYEGFIEYCTPCNTLLTRRATSKKMAKLRAEERAKEAYRKNIEKILLIDVIASKKSKENRSDIKRYQNVLNELRAEEPVNSGSEDDFEEGSEDEIPTPSDAVPEEEEAEETDASDHE